MRGLGAPDFFFIPLRLPFPLHFTKSLSFSVCETAASDEKAIKTYYTWFIRSRPWLRPWCLASGIKLETVSWVLMGIFVFCF
jgi:hypothetical protein